MKKFLSLAIVCVIIVMALISCGDTKCTEHVDADNDGKCDVCGAVVDKKPDTCTNHVDANNDGKCDNCGATVEKKPDTCTNHVDANNDGKCDNCGADVEKKPSSTCTNHVDANNDGKCDNCGATVEKQPEKAAEFTVTFNKNGGGNMETVTVKDGETVSKPKDPEKRGHAFLGWYVGDTEYDFSTKVTADVELKAKWQANKYNLVFGVDVIEVTYGEEIGTLPKVPEKVGQTGVWKVGDDILMSNTVWYYVEDKTADAAYTEIVYKVTLKINGNVYKTLDMKYGQKIKYIDQIDVDGYYTAGWKLDGADYDFTTPVTSDITLDAVMKKLDYSDHIPNIEFSTTNTTKGNNSTFVDTEDGALQIGGSAWDQFTAYTIKTPIGGQYIKTLTVRYKQGDLSSAAVIVRLYNDQGKEIYINLSDIKSSYSGFIKTEKDEDGYILTTIDFANYQSGETSADGENFWQLADRTTTELVKINIVSNNAGNNPTFDYVAFNVVPLPRTDYDPSYMTKRDDNSYYISNFDDEDVLEGASSLGLAPWIKNNNGSTAWTDGVASISHTSKTSPYNDTITGITFGNDSNQRYSGVLYKLPSKFDLTQAKTIVVKFEKAKWNGQYDNFAICFKMGNNYYNVCKDNISKFYNNGKDMSGDATSWNSSVIGANYLRGYLEIDVAAFMEATGISEIDGIYFCSMSTITHTIDEVYYTTK